MGVSSPGLRRLLPSSDVIRVSCSSLTSMDVSCYASRICLVFLKPLSFREYSACFSVSASRPITGSLARTVPQDQYQAPGPATACNTVGSALSVRSPIRCLLSLPGPLLGRRVSSAWWQPVAQANVLGGKKSSSRPSHHFAASSSYVGLWLLYHLGVDDARSHVSSMRDHPPGVMASYLLESRVG